MFLQIHTFFTFEGNTAVHTEIHIYIKVAKNFFKVNYKSLTHAISVIFEKLKR